MFHLLPRHGGSRSLAAATERAEKAERQLVAMYDAYRTLDAAMIALAEKAAQECKRLDEQNWLLCAESNKAQEQRLAAEQHSARLEAALGVILGQIDYTAGNCKMSEMIGALITKNEFQLARRALEGGA